MKTQTITLNGLRHKIYSWGNPKKPKLFLIHGWLDTGASFDFLCRHLQDRFHCLAPDLRGYGKSEHTSNALGYFFYEYVADVHALFQRFSPEEPVRLLGHSLGGAISGFYAGSFPERVSRFINVEGFAFRAHPPERGPERMRAWIENVGAQRFNTFKSLKDFADRLVRNNPRLPPERALFLAKHLAKKGKGGMTMAADPKHKIHEPALFTKPNVYAFWEKIRARCLLVSADQTNMNEWVKAEDFRKEMEERFRHFPKDTKQVEIKDCGHMVHHEKPEVLAKAILSFLK
ncbi:MAG: alpha/beta hydrolase [bacterium]